MPKPVERIVYLLGAGFSQPLGLPVTSDFLFKSRDQHESDRARFADFTKVFEAIDALARIRNYYTSDQLNIEEVLSLLETQAHLDPDRAALRDHFKKYIADVITYHTPALDRQTGAQVNSSWHKSTFLNDRVQSKYAAFVACLHHAMIVEHRLPGREQFETTRTGGGPQYSIVTLNYDTVVESFTAHLDPEGSTFRILTALAPPDVLDRGLPIAKLHGSVGGDIIPPTWNKGLHTDEIIATWRLAHHLLSGATQLRVTGYSLPDSDAYVRYLLKSAALQSSRLKKIDVLCLDDSNGSVERRYKSFVTFDRAKFRRADIAGYLDALMGQIGELHEHSDGPAHSRRTLQYNFLERAHEQFFR